MSAEILRKRIAAGTATFLVKVKAHRGEPANEGADILADKAISDPELVRTNTLLLKFSKVNKLFIFLQHSAQKTNKIK